MPNNIEISHVTPSSSGKERTGCVMKRVRENTVCHNHDDNCESGGCNSKRRRRLVQLVVR